MREQAYDVNGTKVYFTPNNHLNSFCLALYIKAGTLYEDPSETGISHLFEHVVFRNLKCKFEDFYGLMAKHGIDLSGITYKEFVRFAINGPAGEFKLASEILCSLFDEIRISGSELEKEKKRIKAEIRENDNRSSLDYFFNKIVWKDTEIEKHQSDRCKDFDRISLKKINEFRRKCYSQNNFFIYVTGNVTEDDLDALTGELSIVDFPISQAERKNVVSVNHDFFHRDCSVNVKNDYWHYIKIGFDLDCQKYNGGVLDLLYNVLFKTDKALIYQYLSEDEGLIYSYDSTLEVYDNIGNIHFRFEVDGKKVEEAIALVVRILNDMKAGLFDFDVNLKAELYQAMLEVDRVDDFNWSMAYYNHILDTEPLDYSDEFYGRFNVTKEQVTNAAKDIFRPCNMTLAIKGNKRKINAKNIEDMLMELEHFCEEETVVF